MSAGAPVLTVINPDDRWVRIYIRQDQVGRVKIGQVATITADSYQDREYEGRVTFIASDAAAYVTGETVHVNGGMYMA